MRSPLNTPIFQPFSSKPESWGASPRSEVVVVPESAFVFLVPLDILATSSKTGGQRGIVDVKATPGDVYLLDLSKSSKNAINTPFNIMRLYISTQRLAESAYEKELPLVQGLSLSSLSGHDPILYQLAQTMASVISRGQYAPTLLTDYLALAFHAHVARTYGGATSDRLTVKGGLSPWQLRKVYEFIERQPGMNPSISELASEDSVACAMWFSNLAPVVHFFRSLAAIRRNALAEAAIDAIAQAIAAA
jgi:AraC family transcriptional regulator